MIYLYILSFTDDPQGNVKLETESEAVQRLNRNLLPDVEEGLYTVSEYNIALSLEAFAKRLSTQKEKFFQALTAAMEKNEESKREKLQLVVVTLTEALTFIRQSYKHEITCRKGSLMALEKMRRVIDDASYTLASKSVQAKENTLEAEQVFDKIIGKGGKIGAFAAFQSARLAECRMDFNRAMVRFDKAVELDGSNVHYLKSAGVLARKMYQHKKSLLRFMALEKLLVQQGKDSTELALARRDLAYSAALFGQHKQAGAYYKKAMGSLAKLVGKNHPEMGICWFQIGLLQESQGHYEEAEKPYKQALAIMDKAGDNIILADILDKLGRLDMELEGEADAIPLFERLIKIKKNSPHPDLA
ncbi:MAG: tetratricopeptide repeat protein, partial [Candidatus Electrothrix sp. AR4]|nr:tetratricopeptide repeat protein [Candidatus Electrothrix sp. AR4]